jgi:hypothetical protein
MSELESCATPVSGSHLSEVIDRHLRQGWHLYYRGFAVDTKMEARRIQDERLRLRLEYSAA